MSDGTGNKPQSFKAKLYATPLLRPPCADCGAARQLYMIDRGIDSKARLLINQQELRRRETVEILPKDDSGETEKREKENV